MIQIMDDRYSNMIFPLNIHFIFILDIHDYVNIYILRGYLNVESCLVFD